MATTPRRRRRRGATTPPARPHTRLRRGPVVRGLLALLLAAVLVGGAVLDALTGAGAGDGGVHVLRVVDGDTLVVAVDGEEARLRLAIVDTPEVGECGFDEATAFVEGWVADRGSAIDVRRPAGAPARDRFGRLLGEVVVDGDSLNVDLVAAALARIDDRFADEDPDLHDRLTGVRERAPEPACPGLRDAG